MDHAAQALEVAHNIYARANETTTEDPTKETRPPVFKVIGISLAIASGAFIGTSFVLKKVGLLKANEKYNEVAGEGYGYLKNFYWWSGMTLMIIGEICNFVAYAFTDAILVTPLGALSVVITTVLSAIFLKERLSMVGKVACFLCIVGSVVIVMNAPEESSVANIQEMQKFVIAPGFLSYTGVILIGSVITAFYCGPRWGKKNMMVYISICSWVGGLSVVATQGLGSAIVAQAQGQVESQFKQWFLYVLFVFVIGTLLTEIIFLNKALNLFNAAMVTPTYYVYFTSTTIITSAVLFQGFKGTPSSIITVVMGFLVICSGVVLLQLSKSAKDVPDTAVFKGDLDQIHTIAEQAQPETEPKADAIRGAAAIVRRISVARQKMEAEELKRLHEEKERERLETLSEDGTTQYEWDGIRRRRTTMASQRSMSQRSQAASSINPFTHPHAMPFSAPPRTPHLPLGMSQFPSEEEMEEERNRQASPGLLSSIAGTIRSRGRSILLPGHPDFRDAQNDQKMQSPMHPVQLTDIAVPSQKAGNEAEHVYGLPDSLRRTTEYGGAAEALAKSSASLASGGTGRHIQFGKAGDSSTSLAVPPTPPAHRGDGQSARRQFSFQNVFRRHQTDAAQEPEAHLPSSILKPSSRAGLGSRGYSSPQVKDSTEEERLGLVKGDSHSMPVLDRYDDDDEDDDPEVYLEEKRAARYGRGITNSPPRRGNDDQDPEYAECAGWVDIALRTTRDCIIDMHVDTAAETAVAAVGYIGKAEGFGEA
ncbi:hypothetical protein JX265_003623 [Neoarthrinium moseri]|uniref:DUF803 domain membrane protein n=1 Tax=Neoarthrinium moseri TaxID=1658444 RepID=A0A9P9WT47_9PEZI|nr:uncharacterized protein JN550_002369 [Neoarthrinium moseri]KAI1874940.1 hypothetical protein JN550_002369 [Neoarthrinium moseri]KAI1877615.1 hypothetical protein JX265_003623 [Neoarthrinium moseri]